MLRVHGAYGRALLPINPVKNERFFVTQIDPPLKGDKTSYDYYKGQLQLKV